MFDSKISIKFTLIEVEDNLNIPEDPFVRELLPEFVDTWIDDLKSQYKKLIDEQKSEELYRMAHTLKGSCYQFGMNEVGDLGIQIMGFAKEKNWEKAAEMEPILISHFEKLKEYLIVNNLYVQ
ncbi:MAG: Hpt domain-containing protein [Candidatus Kapabacteria bacterium]|nr:Hpt domain-containing protein [Candidatus Kapabacteria bacterium]